MDNNHPELPLSGLRVIEVGHAVMGPTAGLVLADLGAEVIKVERTPRGDDTRRLKGFGTGFFPYFNRNKKSLCVDLKSEAGRQLLYRLVDTADVLLENLGPGTMDRLKLGWEDLSALNPRLIYCSLKGFMPGPYDKRLALDEVVQMMAGLAYMTGPSGRPLRAGASVTDIMGGVFGVVGVLTALHDRARTGRGRLVKSTLFESVAFMMGSHMTTSALSGEPVPPMPERISAWAIYHLFETGDGEKIFIGVTSDKQWRRFCRVFGYDDLAADERLRTNNQRIDERDRLLADLRARISRLTRAEAARLAEQANLPFAPVARPEDLFEDPQMNRGGSLVETELPGGVRTKLPRLPLRIGDYDLGLRNDPPRVGQGSRELLLGLGFSEAELSALEEDETVVL